MLNEMSPYILLGFFIAGLMHAFVPQKTFARHLAGTDWRSVVSWPRTQSLPWPFYGQWHGRVAERCSVCGLHKYESLTCTYQTINEISNVSMPYRFHLHRQNL